MKALRQFVRPPIATTPLEHCDLCNNPVGVTHQHLFDPGTRRLMCSCDGCAILFPGGETKYVRVPRRVRRLDDFCMSDAQWDSLYIPIGLAFFSHHSPAKRVVAMYPSPAGSTESALALDSWSELEQQNPILTTMQPDVEALLVNRVKGTRAYYLVPIDKCYELVGTVRTHWRGLSGGSTVWDAIDRFFDRLAASHA